MNAANILKPALARGDIQVIGATTLDEYKKYIGFPWLTEKTVVILLSSKLMLFGSN